jgi:hypothetical protein
MMIVVKYFWFGCMSLLMVATAFMTVWTQKSGPDMFVLMFPGLWCGLLVTGGHGGTPAQETAGTIVAVAVNMLLVAVPFLLVALVFSKLQREARNS